MFKRILCLFVIFVLSVSAWAEDMKTVIDYYKPDMRLGFIFISKVDMQLTLVNSQGEVAATYPIACGRKTGQKMTKGDNRTPEGYFLLQRVHDSQKWGHDFHDGKGYIKNAYGPYFMRLQTGFQGIGIHGTHAPESIGTRATEGCIRLENSNVLALEAQVKIGMPVIIGPEAGVQSLIASHTESPKHPLFKSYGKGTVVPEAEEQPLLADATTQADNVTAPEPAPKMEYVVYDSAPAAAQAKEEKLLAENVVKTEAPTAIRDHVDEVDKRGELHPSAGAKAETPADKAEPKVETPVVKTEKPAVVEPKPTTVVVESKPVAAESKPVIAEPKVETPVVKVAETPAVAEKPVVAETPVVVETPVVAEKPVEVSVLAETPAVAEVPVVAEPEPVVLPDPVILITPSSTNAAQLVAQYRGKEASKVVVEAVRDLAGKTRYEVRYKAN